MNKELIGGFLLVLIVIAGVFTTLGINYLLTYFFLKRCIKCFHLLEKDGHCQYCKRERNYE